VKPPFKPGSDHLSLDTAADDLPCFHCDADWFPSGNISQRLKVPPSRRHARPHKFSARHYGDIAKRSAQSLQQKIWTYSVRPWYLQVSPRVRASSVDVPLSVCVKTTTGGTTRSTTKLETGQRPRRTFQLWAPSHPCRTYALRLGHFGQNI
jgi:hypothetical protein